MTRTSTASFLAGCACTVWGRRALGKAWRIKFEQRLRALGVAAV